MKLGLGLGLGFGRWTAKVEEVVSVAAPVITMGDTGVFSIACDTAGATIYYTTDGSTPASSSTQYTTPVTVNTRGGFRAIAIKGAASSQVTVMQVWVASAAANGTKYIEIRCKDSAQTISVAGGDAQLKLGDGGTWGNSVVIPAGDISSKVYFRGGTNGGTFAIPNAGYVTYLSIDTPGPSTIFGSINGMALEYLYLSSTYANVTGNITGMPLQTLFLAVTATAITGTPSAIGKTLTSFRVLYGTSYNYPWALQTFELPQRSWTASKMAIDCVAQAPTVEVFDKWLKDLASVSNNGTATLVFKKTPTLGDMTAAGLVGADSGYYAMTTTKGYTLVLGT